VTVGDNTLARAALPRGAREGKPRVARAIVGANAKRAIIGSRPQHRRVGGGACGVRRLEWFDRRRESRHGRRRRHLAAHAGERRRGVDRLAVCSPRQSVRCLSRRLRAARGVRYVCLRGGHVLLRRLRIHDPLGVRPDHEPRPGDWVSYDPPRLRQRARLRVSAPGVCSPEVVLSGVRR
jgi:hypothetical protein